jgi:hypothetical protein
LPVSSISDFTQYFETMQKLRSAASDGQGQILVLVNEFQQAVETILRQEGAETAARFLRHNHDLRMHPKGPLRFVLSGSRSLLQLAQRLGAGDSLTDLSIVDIPPLTPDEAQDFLRRLLYSMDVSYSESALEHIVKRIQWLTPFHIQLAAYELIEEYSINETPLNEALTDKIYVALPKTQNVHFEAYYKRLFQFLSNGDLHFALFLLSYLAREESIEQSAVEELAEKCKNSHTQAVLDFMVSEAYLDCNNSASAYLRYRFTSPLLRRWWRLSVPEMDCSMKREPSLLLASAA